MRQRPSRKFDKTLVSLSICRDLSPAYRLFSGSLSDPGSSRANGELSHATCSIFAWDSPISTCSFTNCVQNLSISAALEHFWAMREHVKLREQAYFSLILRSVWSDHVGTRERVWTQELAPEHFRYFPVPIFAPRWRTVRENIDELCFLDVRAHANLRSFPRKCWRCKLTHEAAWNRWVNIVCRPVHCSSLLLLFTEVTVFSSNSLCCAWSLAYL